MYPSTWLRVVSLSNHFVLRALDCGFKQRGVEAKRHASIILILLKMEIYPRSFPISSALLRPATVVSICQGQGELPGKHSWGNF